MSIFRDRAHAAEIIGGFMNEEAKKEGNFFAGSGVVMAFTLSDPELRVVLDASITPEPGKAFAVYIDDASAPEPAVDFVMSADNFDALYRGEAQPMALMMTGKVKAKGDVNSAMRLLPAMGAAIPRYKAYRQTHH